MGINVVGICNGAIIVGSYIFVYHGAFLDHMVHDMVKHIFLYGFSHGFVIFLTGEVLAYFNCTVPCMY